MNESYRSSAVMDVEPGVSRFAHPLEADERFCILVIGNFGGAEQKGPLRVDRDNLDEVLETIAPEIVLPQGVFSFSELEDFHPDRIGGRCEFPQPKAADIAAPAIPPASTPVPADLLDQMLRESEPTRLENAEFTGDLSEFVRRVSAPYVVSPEDSATAAIRRGQEALVGDTVRAILHNPRFQALEAAWRALEWLVRGLDTDGDLRIYVLDAPVSNLLSGAADLRRSISGSGMSWGAIVLNRAFGQTAEDARALGELGRMAQECGAPLLAEASAPPEDSCAEWAELRHSAEARWIGLILPGFLLRLPYGRETSPAESFGFEEMTGSVHGEYLWGSGAFCCAALLARSFLKDGWRMRPGTFRRIDGLPVHVYREDGEPVVKPCAEILMTDSEAEYLLDNGIMPLASVKGQDAVVLVRFQSLAEPLAGLAGRWE